MKPTIWLSFDYNLSHPPSYTSTNVFEGGISTTWLHLVMSLFMPSLSALAGIHMNTEETTFENQMLSWTLSDDAVTLPKLLVKAVLDISHFLFQFYYICIVLMFPGKVICCQISYLNTFQWYLNNKQHTYPFLLYYNFGIKFDTVSMEFDQNI